MDDVATIVLSTLLALGGCGLEIQLGTGSEASSGELKMVAQPGNLGWAILLTGLAREPESFRVEIGDGEPTHYRRGMFTLPADTPASTFTVYYTLDGKEHGPFEFEFDPATATLAYSKDALDMTRTGWVSWSNHLGRELLYFTHLHMHTCALAKVEYGFDGKLDREWKLPPCRGPSARMGDEPITTDVPGGARSVSVRLTFVDGEQTDVQVIDKP